MIVDDKTNALNDRIKEFEEKLAEFEVVLQRMYSRTEEKIDRVLETLNDIHNQVVNQQGVDDPDEEAEVIIYESENEEDEENKVPSESDYASASSDEVDR